MKYILTKEELDQLQANKIEVDYRKTLTKEMLQEFCSFVADNMPVKYGGNEEAGIWGCILTKDNRMGYCDECPSQKMCPCERRSWSK